MSRLARTPVTEEVERIMGLEVTSLTDADGAAVLICSVCKRMFKASTMICDTCDWCHFRRFHYDKFHGVQR